MDDITEEKKEKEFEAGDLPDMEEAKKIRIKGMTLEEYSEQIEGALSTFTGQMNEAAERGNKELQLAQEELKASQGSHNELKNIHNDLKELIKIFSRA